MSANLRHPITFEKSSGSRDFDGSVEVWDRVFDARAEIKPRSANQQNTDDSIDSVTSHQVKIRFDKRFRPSMRFWFGERCFTIEGAINEDERDEFILIDANEVT